MNNTTQGEVAQGNFNALQQNPYPGRGIVAGLSNTGEFLIQVYWIMGRSENSRNRVLKADDATGRLYTEAADASRMRDPSLIIYNAMRERGNFYDSIEYVVSNGDQTDTVVEATGPLFLSRVLAGRKYEPDAPNFTQRITAVHSLWKGSSDLQMSILRKSTFGETCERTLFEYDILYPGFGHGITTYSGDGNPLPAFLGDPLLMPLVGNARDIAQFYWNGLNEENRVALAVKSIEIGNGRSDIHIINKY